MRKYINMLITITMGISALSFILSEKIKDQLKWRQFQSKTSLVLEITEESIVDREFLYTNLVTLVEENKANIIKTDVAIEDGSIINAVYLTRPLQQYYQTKNNKYITPNNTDELFVLSTNSNEQVDDIILDLFDDDKVTIMTLKSYIRDHDLSGKIYIDFLDKNSQTKFCQQLEEILDNVTQYQYNEPYQYDKSLIIVTISYYITLIILAISFFYYSIYHFKRIGIYKLHGMNNSLIYKKIFFTLHITTICSLLAFIVVGLFYVKQINIIFTLGYIIKLLSTTITIYGLSLILYFVIGNYSPKKMLKGDNKVIQIQRLNFSIRFTVIVVCFCCFSVLLSQYNRMINYSKTMRHWENYSELIESNGIVSNRNYLNILLSNEKEEGYKDFFRYVNQRGDYYISNNHYDRIMFRGTRLEDVKDNEFFNVENFDHNVNFYLSKVNSNYFNTLGLKDMSGKTILFNDEASHRIILMPKSKLENQNYEYLFKAIYLDRMIENEKIPKIEYIVYDDSKMSKFFSFKLDINDDGNYNMESPFFDIVTSNNIFEYEYFSMVTTSIGSPLKFLQGDNTILQIENEINSLLEKSLNHNNIKLKLSSISTPFEEEISKIKLDISISSIGLVVLMIIYSFVIYQTTKLYMIFHNNELAIKYMFGYNIIQSMKSFIQIIFYTDIIAIIFYLVFTQNKITQPMSSYFQYIKTDGIVYLGFIPLIIIDLFITYIVINMLRRGNKVNILKGASYDNR